MSFIILTMVLAGIATAAFYYGYFCERESQIMYRKRGEKMSEKRLITSEKLNELIEKAGGHFEEIAGEFNALPKPTLSDVTGTRKLDSMTEEEVIELGELLGISIAQADADEARKSLYGLFDANKNSKSIKWFIEKGFNVFGAGK